jgi:hypothetical protein
MLGYISPLEFDVNKLKDIVKQNGRLAFSLDDENWLTEESTPEEFARKATEAITRSMTSNLDIFVNEEDYYCVDELEVEQD